MKQGFLVTDYIGYLVLGLLALLLIIIIFGNRIYEYGKTATDLIIPIIIIIKPHYILREIFSKP